MSLLSPYHFATLCIFTNEATRCKTKFFLNVTLIALTFLLAGCSDEPAELTSDLSDKSYYLYVNKELVGPFTVPEIVDRLKNNTFKPSDFVYESQTEEWVTIENHEYIMGFVMDKNELEKPSDTSSREVDSIATAAASDKQSRSNTIMIRQNTKSYSGSCPCPYSTARDGSRCGKRSAYSRSGGRSPRCYP